MSVGRTKCSGTLDAGKGVLELGSDELSDQPHPDKGRGPGRELYFQIRLIVQDRAWAGSNEHQLFMAGREITSTRYDLEFNPGGRCFSDPRYLNEVPAQPPDTRSADHREHGVRGVWQWLKYTANDPRGIFGVPRVVRDQRVQQIATDVCGGRELYMVEEIGLPDFDVLDLRCTGRRTPQHAEQHQYCGLGGMPQRCKTGREGNPGLHGQVLAADGVTLHLPWIGGRAE